MKRKKFTYIPKNEIAEITTYNDITFENDDILDGAYIKGRKKFARGGFTADSLEKQALQAVGINSWFGMEESDRQGLVEELASSGVISEGFAHGGYMADGGEVSLSKYYKTLPKKEDLVGLKVYDENNDEFVYIKSVEGGIFAGKNPNDENGHYYDMSDLSVKKLEDGGYMEKGGNITKGKKYISHWKSQNGDKNYDFVEIIDTNATSNKVGYFGKVVKYKVVESSDKKRIGKIEEDTKDTINTLLKNHLWESYADGGYMAKGGVVWTIGEYQTIEDWNSATKKDGTKTTISAEGYPIRKNGVNVYVVKSKKEAIEKVKRLNSKMANGGYMAQGGVATEAKYMVKYYMKDAPSDIKEKMFSDKSKADLFYETLEEEDDIVVMPIVELKSEAEPAKPKNLFSSAKPVPATAAAKKKRERVQVDGIEDEIKRYDELKAIINNAEAEKEIIGGRLKEIGRDKFLDIYEDTGRRPANFDLADGNENILLEVTDKYLKVEAEKAAILEKYDGLLEVVTTYEFNKDILEKKVSNTADLTVGEVVSMLIQDSKLLSDTDKENLIKAKTTMRVPKGTLDRLMDYDNPREVFSLISPVLALK